MTVVDGQSLIVVYVCFNCNHVLYPLTSCNGSVDSVIAFYAGALCQTVDMSSRCSSLTVSLSPATVDTFSGEFSAVSSSQQFTNTQQAVCDSHRQFPCAEQHIGSWCRHTKEVSGFVVHSPDGTT